MSDLMLNSEGVLARVHAPHPVKSAFARWKTKIVASQTQFFEETPCWNWTGCKSKTSGYGQFKVDGRINKKIGPHVYAFLYYVDDIADGYEVHHRCYNRVCCNPRHLALKTRRANVLDDHSNNPAAINARRTHCVANHPFDEVNTLTTNGKRKCRKCNLARQQAFQAKRRALNNT